MLCPDCSILVYDRQRIFLNANLFAYKIICKEESKCQTQQI
nr:MAG TPA: hypothetical protein [Caudoviricetes sp.]